MNRILGKTLFRRVSWISVVILLLVLFSVLHLFGWRQYTAIISGTAVGSSFYTSALRGVLYALSYFLAIIVSPILLIAMGIDAILRRWTSSRM